MLLKKLDIDALIYTITLQIFRYHQMETKLNSVTCAFYLYGLAYTQARAGAQAAGPVDILLGIRRSRPNGTIGHGRHDRGTSLHL